MNFQEKSAWACLGAILVVFSPYFWLVLKHPLAFIGLFPLAVAILVVLLIGFHIANALATRSIRTTGDTPAPDELDRLIELHAAKRSGLVLAFAVVAWCLGALFAVPSIGIAEQAPGIAAPIAPHISANIALRAIHLLLAGFVVANLVYYASIILGYRRLAR